MEGDLKGRITREFDSAKLETGGIARNITIMQFVITREGDPVREFGPYQVELPTNATNEHRRAAIEEKIRGLRDLV